MELPGNIMKAVKKNKSKMLLKTKTFIFNIGDIQNGNVDADGIVNAFIDANNVVNINFDHHGAKLIYRLIYKEFKNREQIESEQNG